MGKRKTGRHGETETLQSTPRSHSLAAGAPQLPLGAAWDPTQTDGLPLPSIPIQPMSYGDAQHLLAHLGNQPIPSSDWESGLGITHIGPGPAVVNMDIEVLLVVAQPRCQREHVCQESVFSLEPPTE